MAKDDNMFDFAKEIFKINEYASVASDGIVAGDFDGFLDSGSYSLNALLSGSIYGGFPLGKVSALVGASRMGKSFFVLTTMKEFLTKDPKSIVILFESESALSKSMLENFGIDTKRVMVIPVETVERFRHQCLSLLIKYGEQPESERRKMLIVLDSLGMLSTEKEMGDITEGKDTKDMTRAQIIKAAFRVLTLKLGKLGIPFLLTNHSYQTMCLAEDTEIIMADDTTKNLKDINVGEFVKTRFGERKVLKKYTNEELQNDEDMFEIEMEDGSLIKCTGNHSFIRKGIWVEAKFLKEGDELLCD